MIQNHLDLYISFGEERIIFDSEENISFEILMQNFNIEEGSFKLIEIQQNSRVITSRALDLEKSNPPCQNPQSHRNMHE